jgi:hypothetical protein
MTATALTRHDPLCHVSASKKMLNTVIRCARDDVERVNDPKAQALFEATAEVLGGLAAAYDHVEQRSEASLAMTRACTQWMPAPHLIP